MAVLTAKSTPKSPVSTSTLLRSRLFLMREMMHRIPELVRSGKLIEVAVRTTVRIVAVLLIAFGCIWFLILVQGVDVVPGTSKWIEIRWAAYSGLAVAVGAFLLFATKRKTLRG